MMNESYLISENQDNFLDRKLEIEMILFQGKELYKYLKKQGIPKNSVEEVMMWNEIDKKETNNKKIKFILNQIEENTKRRLFL